MSRELSRTRAQERVSFQDRLRAQLAGKLGGSGPGPSGTPGPVPATSCLLLDISGSMREDLGANYTKIQALRKLVQDFPGVRRFQFSWDCEELAQGIEIGEPRGGTAMGPAFLTLKSKGIDHCVLITDGKPDSEDQALKMSIGLRIDVFYVGPDPAPGFLRELARVRNGSYGKADLRSQKELGTVIRGLLGSGGNGAKPKVLP